MEASKVTIMPESQVGLSRDRRYDLKKELVYALIRRRPYGQKLSSPEVAELTDSSPVAAWNFLKTLVERGELVKHQLSPRTAFYAIPEEVRTVGVIADADPQSYFSERDQKIVDYISELPYGKRTNVVKLAKHFGLSQARTYQILTRLVKSGRLAKKEPTDVTYGSFFYVPFLKEDPKEFMGKLEVDMIEAEPASDLEPEEAEIAAKALPSVELADGFEPGVVAEPPTHQNIQSTTESTTEDLEQLAAKFGWEHPLFNNDLREFVKWYQKNHL